MKWRMLLLGAMTSALWGHEIGTTRVDAKVGPDGYRVEIATDAVSLAEKLAQLSGSADAVPQQVDGLRGMFESSDAVFRRRVELLFDGAAVDPEIRYAVEEPVSAGAAYKATIELTGPLPVGAKNLNWKYGWTFATYAFTVSHHETRWLEGGEPSGPIDLAAATKLSRWEIVRQYLTLGFTHILPLGFDHVLFVLGIYLLSGRAKTVLLQVSAFTVAHSITLGLSMYGLVSAPASFVEPAIALSIAYVAIENLFLSELKSWRVALVFGFGLLHGLGFAGALAELGLPKSEFVTALISFNLGVEGGQLAVISIAFLLVGWHFANHEWYRRRIVVPASILIACTALYWTVERIAA